MNNPPWVGFGSVFRRDLPKDAIKKFVARYGFNADVLWWADVIVAALTPWRNGGFKYTNLEWHNAPNRMFVQPTHYSEQARVRALCEEL